MVGVGLVVLILIVVGILMAFVIVAIRAEDQDPTPAARSRDVRLDAGAEERAKHRYARTSPSAAMSSTTVGVKLLPANRVLADRLAQLDDALMLGLIDEEQYAAGRTAMLVEADPTEVIPLTAPDDSPPGLARGLVFGGRAFFLILAATLAVTGLLLGLLLAAGPSIQGILESARP
jgi:hypothetical protein